MVMDADEARAIVAATKYAPRGNRSVGGGFHAINYGATAEEYYHHADDEILVVIQTEHIRAVEVADEIYAVPGIDAIFIGPNDLGYSMRSADGTMPSKEVFEGTLARILQAAQHHRVPCGLHVLTAEDACGEPGRASSSSRLAASSSSCSTAPPKPCTRSTPGRPWKNWPSTDVDAAGFPGEARSAVWFFDIGSTLAAEARVWLNIISKCLTIRPASSCDGKSAVLLWLVGLAAFTAVIWWTLSHVWRPQLSGRSPAVVSRDSAAGRYLGDRSCRDCHPGEFASHSRSGHWPHVPGPRRRPKRPAGSTTS